MDSSFLTLSEVSPSALTGVNVALALFALIIFFKMIIQFGLPNHPGRVMTYMVTLCVTIYFSLQALTGMGFFMPGFWLKWRTLPVVAGSTGLVLQIIMCVGSLSLIQQKVVSRLPLIAGLIFLALFPTKANIFLGAALIGSGAYFAFALGKARYQKRMFYKMSFFILLFWLCKLSNVYWLYVLGEILLLPALFYFFIFEQSFAVMTLIDDFKQQELEVSP